MFFCHKQFLYDETYRHSLQEFHGFSGINSAWDAAGMQQSVLQTHSEKFRRYLFRRANLEYPGWNIHQYHTLSYFCVSKNGKNPSSYDMLWPLTEKIMIDHLVLWYPIFRHPNIICASDWLNWWWKELASLLPEDWADYHDPAHVNDYNNLKDFE